MKRRSVAAVLALALLIAASACGSDDDDGGGDAASSSTSTTNPADNEPTESFYVAPDPLPDGKPGDVIRTEPLDGAPAGSQAWKVLYLSLGLDDEPIAVSGIVIAPTGDASGGSTSSTTASSSTAPSSTASTAPPPPAGERPILSWAHPTTGVVDDCAPSTSSEVFALIPGIDAFLAAGYVIAATDYEGLGTAGVHPYLIGESEGRSVLDAARAARNIADAGAGKELLLWGHSQGGQASLFAGQLASDYAPELDLLATAAAAPAGELKELLSDDAKTAEGVVLGGYAVNAYVDIYGPGHSDMSESQVVTPEGEKAIPEIVKLCDLTQSDELAKIAEPLAGEFFVGDPGSVAPWTTLLADNTPGGTKIPSPTLITQGTADTIVIPATTTELVKRMCAIGTDTTEKTYDGVTHDLIGYESAADVVSWMAGIVAGDTPAPGCT